MDRLNNFWATIIGFLDWRLVRAFGALTALTRASYGMLVIVPLLAGCWPIVQTAINDGKQVLDRRADGITGSADRLTRALEARLQATQDSNTGVNGDTAAQGDAAPVDREQKRAQVPLTKGLEFADEARALSDRLRHLGSSLPSAMPSAWAFAFFAALAVALGQSVYQISAPEIVRRYTLEEYQEAKANPSNRTPTSDEVYQAGAMIRRAEFNNGTFLNRKIVECLVAAFKSVGAFQLKLAELRGTEKSPPTAEMMKAAAETDVVQKAIHTARNALAAEGPFYARECLEIMKERYSFMDSAQMIDRLSPPRVKIDMPRLFSDGQFDTVFYFVHHHLSPPFKLEQNTDKIAHDREKIWIGARVEYIDQSRLKARGMCFVSMAFYAAASLLVVWITLTQAKSVAQAVRWLHS